MLCNPRSRRHLCCWYCGSQEHMCIFCHDPRTPSLQDTPSSELLPGWQNMFRAGKACTLCCRRPSAACTCLHHRSSRREPCGCQQRQNAPCSPHRNCIHHCLVQPTCAGGIQCMLCWRWQRRCCSSKQRNSVFRVQHFRISRRRTAHKPSRSLGSCRLTRSY